MRRSRRILLCLGRRTTQPLDVSGLPCVEKLTDREREVRSRIHSISAVKLRRLSWRICFQFCSRARFPPDLFLQYKKRLRSESDVYGHVRLATARALLKIDVNKTRKIYDFLAEEGHIVKEEVMSYRPRASHDDHLVQEYMNSLQ